MSIEKCEKGRGERETGVRGHSGWFFRRGKDGIVVVKPGRDFHQTRLVVVYGVSVAQANECDEAKNTPRPPNRGVCALAHRARYSQPYLFRLRVIQQKIREMSPRNRLLGTSPRSCLLF